MKVLIVSDNHGQAEVLRQIKARHQGEVDFFIHCGDSELPSTSEEMKGFYGVRGNCDFDDDYPQQLTKEIGNQRLFATHGHLYQVKSSLLPLKYAVEEENANIACFGHSHIAGVEYLDGILFINPGSIELPRMTRNKTYAILDAKDSCYFVHYYNEKGEKLSSHTFEK
ncbi:YfcE family phosphodiesterase [Sutcliffiella horikoshii]|uniref:Phosphoesterase n=1 Tax=Sutcliffiella horikoshii TaxID=79883 RepID=A0A1Y0CRJ9_9BACI|nr:metallophosphoesterase [Sutcliffiella horikoshii]ART77507.1 YfcE family phosphodiesterase [Sutcliffiella horikoshii]TYS59050.1 metallophosphoesterase [Sutcliffiella horikoshii]